MSTSGGYDWRSQAFTRSAQGTPLALGDVHGGRLYHGSPYELAGGDVVRAGIRPRNHRASPRGHVAITSEAGRAAHWAAQAVQAAGEGSPRVYEVEPLGPVTPWRLGPADSGASFCVWEGRAAAVRVVREVPGAERMVRS